MPERFTLKQIREYWSRQASVHGQSLSASWSDHRVIEIEIAEIAKYLDNDDYVLDLGCGNGFSSVQFVMRKAVRVLGVDYIPEMIAQAQQRLVTLEKSVQNYLEFTIGDAMKLDLPDEQFSKVISIRVIINLGEWSDQIRGVLECSRVLKQGGLLLMSEATLQGWRRLNALRNEWNLDSIPMPPFNNYLDEDMVVEALRPQMTLQGIVDFASTYYVGTRVLKPLLVQACGLDIDVANPDMEWNRWFSQLPACGDYGIQKLMVFRKR